MEKLDLTPEQVFFAALLARETSELERMWFERAIPLMTRHTKNQEEFHDYYEKVIKAAKAYDDLVGRNEKD